MSTDRPTPPDPINSRNIQARVLRQKIWQRMNVENEHFMGVIVGREGKGKSMTAMSIGEKVDPGFNAERVMFDPAEFLHRLQEWKHHGETKGKFVISDEAGVGVGRRTWYEKDQIKFNQVLQVIRDENMGMMFALPRLTELDSQTQGRLHAFLEIVEKEPDEWVRLKWFNWDPTRDQRDKIYQEYPRMRVNGRTVKVDALRFRPPRTPGLVDEYLKRKEAFQSKLYAEAEDEFVDDDEDMGPKDIYKLIKDDDIVNQFVSLHGNSGKPYIDPEILEIEFDLSQQMARKVKKLLERDDEITLSK